jgi:hypothetical protein
VREIYVLTWFEGASEGNYTHVVSAHATLVAAQSAGDKREVNRIWQWHRDPANENKWSSREGWSKDIDAGCVITRLPVEP